MARNDGNRGVGVEVDRSAPPRGQLRTRQRELPLEPAAELAAAFECDAHWTEWCRQRNAGVGDIDRKVRKLERLVGRRRQQLVDLAPADAPVHETPAQPHAPGD